MLEAALAAARAGEPQTVLLEGATGVGKTALIEALLDGHDDLRVLRASGEPAEARIALGVVDQLLNRHPAHEPARRARRRRADRARPRRRAMGRPRVRGRDRLRAAPSHGPRPGRRRSTPGRSSSTASSGSPRAAPATGSISSRSAATSCRSSPPSSRALPCAGCGSTPRATCAGRCALLDEVPPDAWRDFERPLPAPRDLTADVARRLASAPAEAADLAAAAAVLGTGCLLADAADAGRHRRRPHSARAGDDGRARARGPPPRPADDRVLAARGRRRGLRAARAGTPGGACTAARRHPRGRGRRAAAPRGRLPRPRHARSPSGSTTFARRCRERPEAAAALVAASRLSTTREQREDRLAARRRLDAAGGRRGAGARASPARSRACAPTARRDSVLGQLAVAGDRVRDAGARLQSAWERCDRTHEPRARGDDRAPQRVPRADPPARRRGRRVGAPRARARAAPSARRRVERDARAQPLAPGPARRGPRAARRRAAAATPSATRSCTACARGCGSPATTSSDARDELAAAAATELRLGALEIGVVHLNVLARAHFEVGAWDDAVAVADRAVALGSQLEDVSARVFVWWAAVLVPAARGDWAAADALRRAAPPPSRPTRPTASSPSGSPRRSWPRPAATPRP